MKSVYSSILFFLAASMVAVAQNCGPNGGNAMCPPGDCCSSWGWCGDTDVHCGPDCNEEFSGIDAPCNPGMVTTTSTKKPTTTTTTTKPPSWPTTIPAIDTCGPSSGNKCPGAGPNGYYYRCCSAAGHCGPKNPLQPASLYCGTGCQAGYSQDCNSKKTPPPPPPPPPAGTSPQGGECGPIVNKKCASGNCCSGSNFCGTGPAYCKKGGEDQGGNWCQSAWGICW
ncbi:hypothetical protein FN846DRAFT_785289 [Sphaerosporella brunnea]|uniref:Chitin-binding type-1 domain-containing protein n=1 Tax=Sphaerosporella brunnea TaxID=1250544 RepID=A0A5J5EJN5_9PEZI|nr:hypothetical protein FN846DRAFT_785289 [Sphaerosporella brunnea]